MRDECVWAPHSKGLANAANRATTCEVLLIGKKLFEGGQAADEMSLQCG